MRAIAVRPRERRIELIDHPEPRIASDTDVALRMLEVGVCGTDREIARFEYGTPPEGCPYLVIGHESLGEVVEVGKEVEALRPGDLVVTTVRRPCGRAECPACRIGRQDFCTTLAYRERGIQGLHGFMTERVVDDVRYMHPLPASLRDVGVLVEPLTIAEKALDEVIDMQRRLPWVTRASAANGAYTALVLGAGPVGLLGALALLVRGFRTWLYSRGPVESDKAAWVRSVGAQYASSSAWRPSDLRAHIGNVDLIYEAAGASQLAFDCLAALGPNGVFVFTGVPGRRHAIEIDGNAIMRNLVLKNQVAYGTVNASPAAFRNATRDLVEFDRRWPKALRALISARHAPEQFEAVLLGDPPGIKHVISFART